MKPSAYLINTARGPVVDEAALVEAIRTRRIAGAGLDVYENEPAMAAGLADCPDTVLLPHLGSASIATRAAMSRMAAENVLALLQDRRPPNLVNPAVWADRSRFRHRCRCHLGITSGLSTPGISPMLF